MRIFSTNRRRDSYYLSVGIPVIIVLAVTTFTILFFGGLSSSRTGSYNTVEISCTPDGHIDVSYGPVYGDYGNTYWNPAFFLSITLGFGSFSYASAKAIDVCFDLLVGRCGQGLLAILAYPILRRSLLSQMERRPVRIPVFASLAFDKVSWTALCTILRDLFKKPEKVRTTQTKFTDTQLIPWNWTWFRFAGFSVVLLYILSFPTLVSVMTGYQAKYTPYVERPDDHYLMQVSQLDIPPIVVRDGKRIGLNDNHPVYKDDPIFGTLLDYFTIALRGPSLNVRYRNHTFGTNTTFQPCYVVSFTNYTKYINSFPDMNPGANSIVDPNCTFKVGREKIPGPSGAYSDPIFISSNITLGNKTWDFGQFSLDVQVQDSPETSTPDFWSSGNITFSSDDLRKKGQCQPSDRYEWGFSSLLLFLFCITTALFAIVLTALHVQPFVYSRADRLQAERSQYRDAVDLVYEMRDNYFGESIQFERDLRFQIEKGDKVIALGSTELPLSRRDEGRRRRGEKEKVMDRFVHQTKGDVLTLASWYGMIDRKPYAKIFEGT